MQRSSAKVQSELGATPAGSSSAVEDIIQPPPSASSRSPVVKKIKHLHKSDSSGEKNNESDKSNEDNDENYLIYDSFSLHFNWRTTLEQLALNITFPLLIPFFIHKFGWLFLHAQSFWPSAAVRAAHAFIYQPAIDLLVMGFFMYSVCFLGHHRDLVGDRLSGRNGRVLPPFPRRPRLPSGISCVPIYHA